MIIKIILFLAVLSLGGVSVLAQKKVKLTGTVTDAETGEPIPLVTVFLPFTTIGTITDEQGFFELNRARLFSGSQRDFFQALYHNRLEQEGFQVKLAWKKYAEIEEFYRENGLELTAKPAVIDSVYDYLPGNNIPEPYYYFVMGEPLPLKSLNKLEENALIFTMYEPILVMYNSWYDQFEPGDPRTALIKLKSGFVTIDSTGYHKVQNGVLEWKYLESGVYVRNYLPLDCFPKN